MTTFREMLDNKPHWIALALFLITVLIRLPFQSQYLYHWDSVNMAFGISSFDVQGGAPQYPGYIVYIAVAQIVNALIGDPQVTMVIISIISSGLAAAFIFYLGRDMFNPTTGLIAALFLITSPLVWFYGEIALPHTMDLFCIILAVWLLYRIMRGDKGIWWFTAILLALIGGFRQQDLLFLGPLILFSIYRIGVRQFILFIVIGFVTTLIWFIPLMHYAGGLQSYLAGSSSFSSSFFDSTSLLAGAGLTGLRRNLINKLIPYTLYGWSLAAIPALYWLSRVRDWRSGLRSRKFWFLALWMAPALGFYVIIHMGQQGLVFVFLPALFLISAEGLYQLFQSRPALLRVSTAAIALFSAAVFLIGPTYPLGEQNENIKLLTYNTLREQDELISNQIAAVRDNFDPEDTLLVASQWRHVQYYLPEYQLMRVNIGSKWEVVEGNLNGGDFVGQPLKAADVGLSPTSDWNVVLVDQELVPFNTAQPEVVQEPSGFEMAYFTLQPEEAFSNDGTQLSVAATTTDS
ncbi:MAG: glycosyltransferase family 39 protein [Anaerolineae bacterium]|nr:glycosyltransferase family 39 protein [Anaerolineae bacterium]